MSEHRLIQSMVEPLYSFEEHTIEQHQSIFDLDNM